MHSQAAIKTEAVTHPLGYDGAEDTAPAATHRRSVLAELEHRIHELELMGEEQFGKFTWFDWLNCVGGSLLLPYLCYVWFWP